MKIAVFAAVALMLTGCTSLHTTLQNSAGAITHCDHVSWGLIGGAIAQSQHDDCVSRAHAAGYSEIPAQPSN